MYARANKGHPSREEGFVPGANRSAADKAETAESIIETRTKPHLWPVVIIIGRVTRWIGGLVFLLSLALAAGCDRGDHPRQIGRPAPDFTVVDGSRSVQLSQYRGKVVVLNFWATWCAPCIEEIPSLNELQRQMPQLVVLGVSVDQNEDAYRKFLSEHRVNFTTIRDGEQHSSALYGTFVFPDTYVIDRKGEIRRKFINAQDWTSPEIVNYLSHL